MRVRIVAVTRLRVGMSSEALERLANLVVSRRIVLPPIALIGESLVLIRDLEHRRAELERRFPAAQPAGIEQTAERTFA
jgi:hypothetical protein